MLLIWTNQKLIYMIVIFALLTIGFCFCVLFLTICIAQLNYSFYACKVDIHLVDKIGWEKRRIYGLNSSNLCLWISRRLCHLTLYE